MNMKIEDIICELGNGKQVVSVAGGKERFTKRIKEVIADVPVYSLQAQIDYVSAPLIFDKLSDIDEYCQNCAETDGIFRCGVCGSFVGNFGYYRDNEYQQVYDCLECLTNDFNKRFGKGNWTTMLNSCLDFGVHVKVDDSMTEAYEDLIKKDGTYWREYDIEYITISGFGEVENMTETDDDDVLV